MSRMLAVAAAGGLALMLADTANAVAATRGPLAFPAFAASSTDLNVTTVFPLNNPLVHGSPPDDFRLVPLPVPSRPPAGAVDLSVVSC